MFNKNDIAFWSQNSEDILNLPTSVLSAHIQDYYDKVKKDDIEEITLASFATELAFEKIKKLKFQDLEKRIANLEQAGSMSFLQVAFSFALTGVIGTVVGKIAQIAMAKILRSRLLIGTTAIKTRIPSTAASKTNIQELRKRGAKLKLNKKHNFYESTEIVEVNLGAGWANTLLEHGPSIFGDSIAEGLKASSISDPADGGPTLDIADYFSDKVQVLDEQKRNIDSTYSQIINEINIKFLSDITESEKMEFVSVVKENFRANQAFIKKYRIDNQSIAFSVKRKKILSQPILITAIASIFSISHEILPRREGVVATDIVATVGGGRPISYTEVITQFESVKLATPTERNRLINISKILFVPGLMEKYVLETFHDHYAKHENAEKAQVEVVKLFKKRAITELVKNLRRLTKPLKSLKIPF